MNSQGIANIEEEASKLRLDTAKNHLAASKVALQKVTESLDMRTVCLAQMAATIISNAHPSWAGTDAAGAVKLAEELLAAVEASKAKAKELQEARYTDERCEVPPAGWRCSRKKGHAGPCAAARVIG